MVEITAELLAQISDATLKVLKSYTLYPVNDYAYEVSPSGTSFDVDFDAVPNGQILFITSIAAIPKTNAGDAIKIGIVSGGTPFWQKVSLTPTAGVSTVFGGQLILAEGEFIRVRFEYTAAPDQLDAYINGYWIYV